MRSLLAAILSLFLPPRGARRAACTPTDFPFLSAYQPSPERRMRPHSVDVIPADGFPLVRPYLAAWEREWDERDQRRLQRDRRRAAVLATLGQDYIPAEVA